MAVLLDELYPIEVTLTWNDKAFARSVLEQVIGETKHLPGKHDQTTHGRKVATGLSTRSALINKIRGMINDETPQRALALKNEIGLSNHDMSDVHVKDIPGLLEVLAVMPRSNAVVAWHTFDKAHMQSYLDSLASEEGQDERVYNKAAGITSADANGYNVATFTLQDTEMMGTLRVQNTKGASYSFQVMRAVVAHEYAHVLDSQSRGGRLSDSAEWLKAFHSPRFVNDFPSMYANDNPAETFAEMVALMTIEPTRSERAYPHLFAAASHLLQWDPRLGVVKSDVEDVLPPRKFYTLANGVHIEVLVDSAEEKHLPGRHDQTTHGHATISYVGGETTFNLSAKADELKADPEWKWSDDLLVTADGHRPGGFTEAEDARTPEAISNLRQVLVKHGFTDVSVFGSPKSGLVVVNNAAAERDKPLGTRNEFLDAAIHYMSGQGFTLTDRDQRVMGSWLGFPKESTTAFLKRLKQWNAGEPLKSTIEEVNKHLPGKHNQLDHGHSTDESLEQVGQLTARFGKPEKLPVFIVHDASALLNGTSTTQLKQYLAIAVPVGSGPVIAMVRDPKVGEYYEHEQMISRAHGANPSVDDNIDHYVRLSTSVGDVLEASTRMAGYAPARWDEETANKAIDRIYRAFDKLARLGLPGDVKTEIYTLGDLKRQDIEGTLKSTIAKHLPGKHDQQAHAGQQPAAAAEGIDGTIVYSGLDPIVTSNAGAFDHTPVASDYMTVTEVKHADRVPPFSRWVYNLDDGKVYFSDDAWAHASMSDAVGIAQDRTVRAWADDKSALKFSIFEAGLYQDQADFDTQTYKNIDRMCRQLVRLGLPASTPIWMHTRAMKDYASTLKSLVEKHLPGRHDQTTHAPKTLQDSEHQRAAQAARSHVSLSESGKLGYKALVDKYGVEYAQDKSADWRREHPTKLQTTTEDMLDELNLPFQREVKLASGIYADLVVGDQKHVVEVDGKPWHANKAFYGSENRADADLVRDDKIRGLGYQIIHVTEDDIHNGGAAIAKLAAYLRPQLKHLAGQHNQLAHGHPTVISNPIVAIADSFTGGKTPIYELKDWSVLPKDESWAIVYNPVDGSLHVADRTEILHLGILNAIHSKQTEDQVVRLTYSPKMPHLESDQLSVNLYAAGGMVIEDEEHGGHNRFDNDKAYRNIYRAFDALARVGMPASTKTLINGASIPTGLVAGTLKHLPGRHDQLTHGGERGEEETGTAQPGSFYNDILTRGDKESDWTKLGMRMPTDDELFSAFIVDIKDANGVPVQTHITVTATYSPKGEPAIKVLGVCYNGDTPPTNDLETAMFERYFMRNHLGEPMVYHAAFVMPVQNQSQGIGMDMIERSEAMYEAIGVKEVQLHANSAVGKYAWPKAGFDFGNTLIKNRTVDAFYQYLNSAGVPTEEQPKSIEHSWDIAAWKPKTSVLIEQWHHNKEGSFEPIKPREVSGKDFLLRSAESYDVSKRLDPTEPGYQLGKRYYAMRHQMVSLEMYKHLAGMHDQTTHGREHVKVDTNNPYGVLGEAVGKYRTSFEIHSIPNEKVFWTKVNKLAKQSTVDQVGIVFHAGHLYMGETHDDVFSDLADGDSTKAAKIQDESVRLWIQKDTPGTIIANEEESGKGGYDKRLRSMDRALAALAKAGLGEGTKVLTERFFGDKEPWRSTLKSAVDKHLPGEHDQLTHGRPESTLNIEMQAAVAKLKEVYRNVTVNNRGENKEYFDVHLAHSAIGDVMVLTKELKRIFPNLPLKRLALSFGSPYFDEGYQAEYDPDAKAIYIYGGNGRTVLHEIGHFLDSRIAKGASTGWNRPTYNTEDEDVKQGSDAAKFKAVVDAVMSTNMYKVRARSKTALDRYFTQPEEIFAAAFEQYVASKSPTVMAFHIKRAGGIAKLYGDKTKAWIDQKAFNRYIAPKFDDLMKVIKHLPGMHDQEDHAAHHIAHVELASELQMAKRKSDERTSLAKMALRMVHGPEDYKRAKKEMDDAVLESVNLSEQWVAARQALGTMPLDFKHLPGQHDQDSHGNFATSTGLKIDCGQLRGDYTQILRSAYGVKISTAKPDQIKGALTQLAMQVGPLIPGPEKGAFRDYFRSVFKDEYTKAGIVMKADLGGDFAVEYPQPLDPTELTTVGVDVAKKKKKLKEAIAEVSKHLPGQHDQKEHGRPGPLHDAEQAMQPGDTLPRPPGAVGVPTSPFWFVDHIKRIATGKNETYTFTKKNGSTVEKTRPQYKFIHSVTGKEITDPVQTDALRKWAPPSVTEVMINPNITPDVVAVTWTDAKGRTQRRYNKAHDRDSAAEKFQRLKDFNKAMPKIRKQIRLDLESEDARTRETAAVAYLIQRTGFRIGGEGDTKAEVQAYGASTLLNKHVKVVGNKVMFDFIGKKGMRIHQSIQDSELAKIVNDRKSTRWSQQLFDTRPSQVDRYIHKISGNKFSAKDFRTWLGTSIALKLIKRRQGPARDEKIFSRWQKDVATKVAKRLGNTASVSISNYINPMAWDAWRQPSWGPFVPKNIRE